MEASRLITPAANEEDAVSHALRPEMLADFTGQPEVRENLDIFIKAARTRGDVLDHVLPEGWRRTRVRS